jgi:hypothetical protein
MKIFKIDFERSNEKKKNFSEIYPKITGSNMNELYLCLSGTVSGGIATYQNY